MKKRITQKTISELTVRDGLVIYFLLFPFVKGFMQGFDRAVAPKIEEWTKLLKEPKDK
jgi:hypothetical protein